MADINEILGRNINSIKELKTAIGELQNSLIGVDATSEEFKTTSEKLTAAQAELTKVTRAGKEENLAATDSIRGMEQQYKSLYDQYKLLSEEQRNSDFGKGMAEALEQLSTKINDSKKEVGNFTSNIGRYAQGATEAFSKMGISLGALQKPLQLASGGVKALGTSLKSLIANPVGAVIMAVVVAFKALQAIVNKVRDAIKNNEESSNRLKEAMATFKPVLDAVNNAFDFLGKIVVRVVEGLANVAGKIMSIIPGMKQAVQSHKDLAKATNELTKAQREASVENSKKGAEVERLREEASATQDVLEKRELLEQAKAIQSEIDQENIRLAQEELRIMEEYAAKTANSAEENEKLAAAQKKVNDAIAQGERNMRLYNKQLSTTEKSISSTGGSTKSAIKSIDEYKQKAKELYDQLIENNKTEIQKLTDKYVEEKKLLEKYHYDTKLLTKKYSEDIAAINKAAWKKEREAYKETFDSWTDDIARWYENRKQLAESNTEVIIVDEKKLQDAKDKLEDFKKETERLVGETQDSFGKMMQYVLEYADLSKITDFDYITNILKHNVQDADMDEVLNAFYNFGEESWIAFTDGLEEDVQELNDTFGLSIKNTLDLEARAKQLGKDIAQKYGEAVITFLEEWRTKELAKFYEEIVMPDLKLRLNPDLDLTGIKDMVFWTQNQIASFEYALLEGEQEAIEAQLEKFSGTTEQKLELMQRYYEIVAEMRDRDQALADLNNQRTMEMVENLIDMTDGIGNSLGTIKSSYEQVIESEVKAGKIDEEQARKKKKRLQNLEKAQTAFSIASIAADAAAGIFSVWKGYAAEVGTVNPQTAAAAGPGAAAALGVLNTKSLIAAIAKTTALAATATAQIMAARNGQVASNNNFAAEGGGGGETAGVGATPMLIDSTPYSYTRTVQTPDEEELNQRPIWVSVVDVEEGLGQRAKVVGESSF